MRNRLFAFGRLADDAKRSLAGIFTAIMPLEVCPDYAMPYGAGVFHFTDPTKETEVDFTNRIAASLEKFAETLSVHAKIEDAAIRDYHELLAQQRAVRAFLGIEKSA